MLAKDLISEVIPVVKTSDTGAQTLTWMENFRVSHLPVVNNTDFLGLVSDSDIYALDDPDAALGSHHLSLFSPFVLEQQHFYEVVDLVHRLNLTIIPVLNQDKVYLGSIVLRDLVKHFARFIAADQPGAIIILSMTSHDYSITEIGRLIEENNAKLLSLSAVSPPDSMQLEVSLKVNTQDVTSILRSFERYGYAIHATYLEDEELDDLYRSRYEEFMRYLNT